MAYAWGRGLKPQRELDRPGAAGLSLNEAGRLPDIGRPSEAAPACAEAARKPSTRYVDQPLSWGARLFGMGGVTMIVLLILGGMFLTWRTYSAPSTTPALSVFDVAVPAAPPEPPREIPPGPEQVEKQQPLLRPEPPQIAPPEIQIASDNPVTLPLAEPAPDPGPPVKDTSAPEAKPAPAAQQASNAKPTWEGAVLAALNTAKRYPREASFRRQQGVPYIRFVMDREGKVLSSRLESSCGVRALDEEAVALPRRASPLPKPPGNVKGDIIELVVPVEFFFRGR